MPTTSIFTEGDLDLFGVLTDIIRRSTNPTLSLDHDDPGCPAYW